jgi:glutamyl-tRNA reductase
VDADSDRANELALSESDRLMNDEVVLVGLGEVGEVFVRELNTRAEPFELTMRERAQIRLPLALEVCVPR